MIQGTAKVPTKQHHTMELPTFLTDDEMLQLLRQNYIEVTDDLLDRMFNWCQPETQLDSHTS
jgi:hypothetical protein